MNRLSDHDWNFGPITIGRWHKSFGAHINSGDDDGGEAHLLVTAFGRALRIRVFNWLCRPWREKWVECNWDAETVKRLGRSGYWSIHPRRYGFSLSDMGNGYDFLQVFFGPQTHDSSTTKNWCCHLPWKEWRHVRHSLYTPSGTHFHTEQRGEDFTRFLRKREECPKVSFEFLDHDGEHITATCVIEEREWHKGTGWLKWLRWLYKPKIHRSLDLSFDKEVGPEKGSWKGGATGHGIDMLPGEPPEEAFRRYCALPHRSRGKDYRLTFVGPKPQ